MEKKIELEMLGNKMVITINVVRGFGSSTNLDGDIVSLGKFVETTKVSTAISGHIVSGEYTTHLYHGTPSEVAAQVIDWGIRAQINLDAAQYGIYKATLDAMVAEEESKPEVVAYREKCRKNVAESRDYDRFAKRVENAMTLNGRTY